MIISFFSAFFTTGCIINAPTPPDQPIPPTGEVFGVSRARSIREPEKSGITDELLRRFSVVLVIREETMQEAIVRMMEEELERLEEYLDRQDCGTNPVTHPETLHPGPVEPVSPAEIFRNTRIFTLKNVVPMKALYPESCGDSQASVHVICRCSDTGPVVNTMQVEPLLKDVYFEYLEKCPIPRFRLFSIYDLPEPAMNRIIESVHSAWEADMLTLTSSTTRFFGICP